MFNHYKWVKTPVQKQRIYAVDLIDLIAPLREGRSQAGPTSSLVIKQNKITRNECSTDLKKFLSNFINSGFAIDTIKRIVCHHGIDTTCSLGIHGEFRFVIDGNIS